MNVNDCLISLNQDFQNHLLTQRKQLENGRYMKIFTTTPSNSFGEFIYNCELCEVSSLNGVRLRIHIFEPEHQKRMNPSYMMDTKDFKTSIKEPTIPLPPSITEENMIARENYEKAEERLIDKINQSGCNPELMKLGKEYEDNNESRHEISSKPKVDKRIKAKNAKTMATSDDEDEENQPTTVLIKNSKVSQEKLDELKNQRQEIYLKFKEYRRKPDSHPCYLNEWKLFYLTRHGELLKQGREANGYDYKPEWLKYWSARVKELKLLEFEEIRKKSNEKKACNETASKPPSVSLAQQPTTDLSFGESEEEMGAQNRRRRFALYRRTQSLDEIATTNERSRSPQQKRSFTLDSNVRPSFDFHPSLCTEQQFRAELARKSIVIPNPPKFHTLNSSASESDDETASSNGIRCMVAVGEQNGEKLKEGSTADKPSIKINHSEVSATTDEESNPPSTSSLPVRNVQKPNELNFNTQKSLPGTSKQFTQASHSKHPKNSLLHSALKKLNFERSLTTKEDDKSINDKKFFDYFKETLDRDPKEAQKLLDCLNTMKTSHENSISVQATTPSIIPPPLNLNCSTSTAQSDNESIVAEWTPKRDTEVTLLTTTLVQIKNSCNGYEMCRALLDTGSTSNFISKSLAKKLGIKSRRCNIEFQSVGHKKIQIYGQLNLNLRSRHCRNEIGFYEELNQFFIIDEVYGCYPHRFLDVRNFRDIPSQLYMADPLFFEPRKVDAILGNGIVFPCILNGSFRIDCGLTVKETKFGYTTGGTFDDRYMG